MNYNDSKTKNSQTIFAADMIIFTIQLPYRVMIMQAGGRWLLIITIKQVKKVSL